jgi:hypothetical protein
VRSAIKEEVKARIEYLKQTEYGKEFLMCMEVASVVVDLSQLPKESSHSGAFPRKGSHGNPARHNKAPTWKALARRGEYKDRSRGLVSSRMDQYLCL